MAELTEDAVEVAEEVIELAERAGLEFYRKPELMVTLGLAMGGGIGYLIARKREASKYEAIMALEVAELKEHYAAKEVVRDDKPEMEDVMDTLGYRPEPKVDLKPPVVVQPAPKIQPSTFVREEVVEETVLNVFENENGIVWDYSVETKRREMTPDGPHILHVDEYNAGEKEYDQDTLTWYDGDDVLCDNRDNIVEHGEEKLGLQNLQLFGKGSGDPNVLYIRNDQFEMDYEVIRSDGSYAQEVQGLQHSDEPEWRGPRHFDDE